MKNLFFTFCLLFIGGFSLLAQEAPSTSAPLEKSLLWEITGKDLTQPSYLYGTIHLIDKESFFFTDATKEAMDKVEGFAFEIDMNEMNDPMKIMPLMMKAMMPGDSSLSNLLSPEDYKKVSDHFQKMGLPMMMLERIKPMFLSALVGNEGGGDMFSNPMGGGNGSTMSYEFEIMEVANKREKPISGLESMEFQMSIFDSIPYRAQAKMLVDAVSMEKDSASSSQLDELVKIYKDQDIEAMINAMDDEGGIGGYENILLDNRNKNWIPIMEEKMAENTMFFAVGAGHLAGENGVIKLLRKAGYELKPLY
ncbi:MAG: TraB/GumN family protein [Bacteroidota bacterium]